MTNTDNDLLMSVTRSKFVHSHNKKNDITQKRSIFTYNKKLFNLTTYNSKKKIKHYYLYVALNRYISLNSENYQIILNHFKSHFLTICIFNFISQIKIIKKKN